MILDGMLRPLRIGLAALALSAVSASAGGSQAPPDEVQCSYTRRMVCSVEGCRENEIGSSHLRMPSLPSLRAAVDSSAPIEIRRCDAGGCAPVEITDAGAGGFLTLSGRTGAYLLKIYAGPPIEGGELDTGAFIEVVTSMLTTFVAYGRCPVAP